MKLSIEKAFIKGISQVEKMFGTHYERVILIGTLLLQSSVISWMTFSNFERFLFSLRESRSIKLKAVI